MKCPKCRVAMTTRADRYPLTSFVGGKRVHRRNGTLGEWWICTNRACEDGQRNAYAIGRAGGIVYKEFYNKDRGLPEPKWGPLVEGLQCPSCGSQEMYSSAHPDDPEEIIGVETVRCGHCGAITDYYEAHKQRRSHPTDEVREVVRG